MKRLWTPLLLLVLGLCGPAQAEVDVPKLSHRVTDLTGTLDAGQQQSLENKLAAFEARKGAQVAVLVLPSTQPETIEQFGIRVAEQWKLGRKGVDDGALLLVAKDDRRLRIEVGYGLEGALNDATSKRIVSEVITPLFKRGEYYAGIDAGLDSIFKVIDGEPLPAPSQPSSSANEQGDGLGEAMGAAFVIFMIGNVLLRQLLGRLPSGLIVGGVIGLLVWAVLSSLILAIVVGVVAFVLSLFFGEGVSSHLPSGWGGSSGGWGGGGGFSGGDFGGGGGSFGGGGASGDW